MKSLTKHTLTLLLALTVILTALPAFADGVNVVIKVLNSLNQQVDLDLDADMDSQFTNEIDKILQPKQPFNLTINESSVWDQAHFRYYIGIATRDGSIQNDCRLNVVVSQKTGETTIQAPSFSECNLPSQVEKTVSVEGTTVYATFVIE